MGQRHQLFVIAKIANRYRGLAVFHHQWLYGARALKQCLALLTIFSSPANRLAILQELAAAKRHGESFWTKPSTYDDCEVPFPFISTCLLLGASFDVKDGYNANVTPEPFNMAFNGGVNNDGITVIDITDLSHVRYCFVLWAGREAPYYDNEVEGPQNVLEMRPLSGPTYLGAYYNAKQRKRSAAFQSLMQQYDHWDLIEVDALANAWPNGKWLGADSELGRSADIPTAILTPTLRESALARLVETSLQSVDTDLSWIEEAELLSDFLPAIRVKLGSEPALIASPAAKVLLLRATKDEEEVNLSQFPDFSRDDLVSLTSKLSNKTTSISLSGHNVTAAFLDLDLLAVNTSLRKLYVLDAPNLQLQSALRLMYQPRSPWIYHQDMFRKPIRYLTQESHNHQQNANDQDIHQPNSNEILYIAGRRVKFPVVQIFWLSREFSTADNISRLDDGGIPWAQLLPPQDRHNKWLEPSLAAFPLRDALLPTTRAVTGLAKFVHYLTKSDGLNDGMTREGTVGMVAAKCFALAASDLEELDVMKQVEVHPLPEELFTIATEMYASSDGPPAPEVQPLRPGEWTIIIAHEPGDTSAKREKRPSGERLRYAFLTASDPAASGESDTATITSPAAQHEDVMAQGGRREVVIADMKIFLERVMNDEALAQEGLVNFWNEATKGLADEFGVCGKSEIASILEAMSEYSRRRIHQLNGWCGLPVWGDT